MTLLTARGLHKAFGAKPILSDVGFTLSAGDRVGLIGRNGAGKSTLVRILTGAEDADAGEMIRRRDLTLAAVDQNPDLSAFDTVGDAVLSGLARHQSVQSQLHAITDRMDGAPGDALAQLVDEQAALNAELERLGGWNIEHQADAMADALKVPPKDRRPATLSLGEQRRVALAVVLLSRPDVLILDEPTNHLDVTTIQWLQDHLTTYPGAILLVTHDRYFLDDVANRIVELDRGRLSAYAGNYTAYIIEKAEREAQAARSEERRQSAIRSELKWVRRSAPARTTKQKARLERFDALVADRPVAAEGEATLHLPHPPRIGKTILEIRGLTKAFDDRVLIDGLDLTLKKGDRIGIVGPNGAGKTTFVRMILGTEPADSGKIKHGVNTKTVYADQARADLDDQRSVREEVAGDNDQVFVGERAIPVQTFLDHLLFEEATQRTPVGALSGGERSRVALAKSLRVPGNLLILDEPTNDLDLNTLRVLEDALARYPGCVLVISHDRYFLDRVATAILAFEGQGRVVLYEGSYALYRERWLKPNAEVTTPRTTEPAKPKNKPKPKATRTRRTFKEEQAFKRMETDILAAEEAVQALQDEVNDPDAIRALGPRMKEKLEALKTAEAKVETLYADWATLSDLDPYGS